MEGLGEQSVAAPEDAGGDDGYKVEHAQKDQVQILGGHAEYGPKGVREKHDEDHVRVEHTN